jgi:hypothetical protein
MAGAQICSGKSTASDQRKTLNFAQGDDNNESNNLLYLPIIDQLRQAANLLSRLLQQRRRWVGGDKVWGKEGTKGWDQVRGGWGRGERQRQRERYAAHTSCQCPLICWCYSRRRCSGVVWTLNCAPAGLDSSGWRLLRAGGNRRRRRLKRSRGCAALVAAHASMPAPNLFLAG